jgi:hypothetical protein
MTLSLLPDDKLSIEGRFYKAPCWPPPAKVIVNDQPYALVRWSQLTNEEMAKMDFVWRGAEYEKEEPGLPELRPPIEPDRAPPIGP